MGGGTTKSAFEDKEEVKELYGIASKTIRKMEPKKPMKQPAPKKPMLKMGEKEDIIGDIIDKGYTDKTLPKKYRAKPQPNVPPVQKPKMGPGPRPKASPKPNVPPVQEPKNPTVGRVKLPKQLSV